MIKNLTKLEHKVGNRIYQLTADQDSPTSEVKEALFHFLGYIWTIEKQAFEKKEKESNPVEVPNG